MEKRQIHLVDSFMMDHEADEAPGGAESRSVTVNTDGCIIPSIIDLLLLSSSPCSPASHVFQVPLRFLRQPHRLESKLYFLLLRFHGGAILRFRDGSTFNCAKINSQIDIFVFFMMIATPLPLPLPSQQQPGLDQTALNPNISS